MDRIIATTVCAVELAISVCPPPRALAEPGAPMPAAEVDDIAALRAAFAAEAGDAVYFARGRFKLTSSARATLSRQAAWLARRDQLGVVIVGEGDELGAREGNFTLGARRADAVFDYLSAHGVAFFRIRKAPYGALRPSESGACGAAGAQNHDAQTVLTGLSSR
jgi:peptidoglycan-associated lipoprotein